MGLQEEVEHIVARALLSVPEVSLYDLEVKGGGSSRVVAVVVDKPGGVGVDDCAAVSEVVSAALDAADPVPGSYRLDISSPGMERPLAKPAHFRTAVGSVVQVKVSNAAPVRGVLESADDTGVVVRVEHDRDSGETKSHEVRVAYRDMTRARTVVDWAEEIRADNKARRERQPVRQGKTR